MDDPDENVFHIILVKLQAIVNLSIVLFESKDWGWQFFSIVIEQ